MVPIRNNAFFIVMLYYLSTKPSYDGEGERLLNAYFSEMPETLLFEGPEEILHPMRHLTYFTGLSFH